MARRFQRQAIAVAITATIALPLLLGAAVTTASTADGPSTPSPTAVLPFPAPYLEGAQAKVAIGVDAPGGPALSYIGGQNAWVNFSVWWWDTGPATSASVFVDGTQYTMSEVPGQDGIYENGTLYRAMVNATDLGSGSHSWYYSFTGPSGAERLPATGTMGDLVQDDAEMFIDQGLIVSATQTLLAAYNAGNLPNLRAVVEQAVSVLDPRMSSSWNGSDVPYDYVDANHNITGPTALTSAGTEVFVGQNGQQQAAYGDSGMYLNNSQPAHKQALALRGLLLASGLFNESDLVMMSDEIIVNGTPFYHAYLQVALNDLSELPGDGTADGDNRIDVDLWAAGLEFPISLGRHFGDEDLDTADDREWNHSVGWPPVNDTLSDVVLWHRANTFRITGPDGNSHTFHVLLSGIDAIATRPIALQAYWKDEPIVFDALASNQSMFLDMRFTWSIMAIGINGAGPVWGWNAPVTLIGAYTVVLTAIDVYGNQDTVSIGFILRAKTELRQPIPSGSFIEDSRFPMDLRAYFGDDDGFNTISFDVRASPAQIHLERTPPTAPNFSFSADPDWCGPGSVTIDATDGASPVVSVTFALNVTCVNDGPVLSGIPDVVDFEEGGDYVVTNLSQLAFDADGDTLTWSMPSSTIDMFVDVANDRIVFSPKDPEWFGTDGTAVSVTDGLISVFWPITFLVSSVNDGPVVSSPISTYTILEDAQNTSIRVTDHFMDPDGDTLTGVVTADNGLVAGYFAPLGTVWFHPVANFSGPTGLTIRVRDQYNASVTVHVDVDVAPQNDAPLIIDFEPKGYVTGVEGESFIFVVQSIDSDTSVLTYTFSIDGVEMQESSAASYQWVTDHTSSGRHDLSVVVSDSSGGEDSYSWQIQITNENRAPSVSITITGGNTHDAGKPVEFTAEGTDQDGEELTYAWNFGGVIQPKSGRVINATFGSAGNYTVRVTVTDGIATSSSSIVVNIVYKQPTQPPPPPPQNNTTAPGFLPAPPAVVAVIVAAALLAVVARRKREE